MLPPLGGDSQSSWIGIFIVGVGFKESVWFLLLTIFFGHEVVQDVFWVNGIVKIFRQKGHIIRPVWDVIVKATVTNTGLGNHTSRGTTATRMVGGQQGWGGSNLGSIEVWGNADVRGDSVR